LQRRIGDVTRDVNIYHKPACSLWGQKNYFLYMRSRAMKGKKRVLCYVRWEYWYSWSREGHRFWDILRRREKSLGEIRVIWYHIFC